jgi:hypothetical protein
MIVSDKHLSFAEFSIRLSKKVAFYDKDIWDKNPKFFTLDGRIRVCIVM